MAAPQSSSDSDFRVKLEFRKVLNNVSEGLSTKNLSSLKYLCHDKISERSKEEIQTGWELFELLLEKGDCIACTEGVGEECVWREIGVVGCRIVGCLVAQCNLV